MEEESAARYTRNIQGGEIHVLADAAEQIY